MDPITYKTRRSFDLDFKLKVVKFAKEKSGEAAAKEYGVDPKQVREWKKREPEMLRLLSNKQNKGMRKRCGGAGRKKLNTELDFHLLNWVMNQQMNSLPVSRLRIRKQAEMIFPTLNDNPEVSFKASTGWLCKFLERNKLSLCKKKTAAQGPKEVKAKQFPQAHLNPNMDPISSYTTRRSFDLDFKLQVVKFAKENSGEAAAKEYGVDPKQVREWKKREPEMLRLLSTKQNKGTTKMRKRCAGAGRKLLNTDLDFHLRNWIMNQQMNSLPLSRRIIRKQAEKMFPTLNDNKEVIFKASRGWLCHFLTRNKLSLRKRNTAAQVPA